MHRFHFEFLNRLNIEWTLYTPQKQYSIFNKLKCFRRVVQRVNSIFVPAICSNGGEFWLFSALKSIENRLDRKYDTRTIKALFSSYGMIYSPQTCTVLARFRLPKRPICSKWISLHLDTQQNTTAIQLLTAKLHSKHAILAN